MEREIWPFSPETSSSELGKKFGRPGRTQYGWMRANKVRNGIFELRANRTKQATRHRQVKIGASLRDFEWSSESEVRASCSQRARFPPGSFPLPSADDEGEESVKDDYTPEPRSSVKECSACSSSVVGRKFPSGRPLMKLETVCGSEACRTMLYSPTLSAVLLRSLLHLIVPFS